MPLCFRVADAESVPIAVKGGFVAASLVALPCCPVVAYAYAYYTGGFTRAVESNDDIAARERAVADARHNLPVTTSAIRQWTAAAVSCLCVGRLSGAVLGVRLLQGLLVGVGVVVGYAVVAAFIVGSLVGVVVQLLLKGGTVSYVFAFMVAALLTCCSPLIWYMWCTKRTRLADGTCEQPAGEDIGASW